MSENFMYIRVQPQVVGFQKALICHMHMGSLQTDFFPNT